MKCEYDFKGTTCPERAERYSYATWAGQISGYACPAHWPEALRPQKSEKKEERR